MGESQHILHALLFRFVYFLCLLSILSLPFSLGVQAKLPILLAHGVSPAEVYPSTH